MRLDETDQRLIELLRGDSRLPAATLARILGVSRGTVQNRIDRLVRERIIRGFTLRLSAEAEANIVRAVTAMEIRAGDARAVVAALKRNPCCGRDSFHQRAVGFGRRYLYDGFGQLGPHYQSHPGNPGSDALGNEHPAERALGIVVSRAVTDGLIILGRVCEGGHVRSLGVTSNVSIGSSLCQNANAPSCRAI